MVLNNGTPSFYLLTRNITHILSVVVAYDDKWIGMCSGFLLRDRQGKIVRLSAKADVTSVLITLNSLDDVDTGN